MKIDDYTMRKLKATLNISDEVVDNIMSDVSNNVEKHVTDELSKKLAEAIDREMLGEFQGKVLSDNKIDMDPEYLHKIKEKVEMILSQIVKKHGLQDCLSEKYRYRVDTGKLYASRYHKLFEENKDIDGKILRRGYEYIPVDFDDWMNIYVPDYVETANIYSEMCGSRRIRKEDLIYLNKIAKKYKVTSNE